MPPYFLKSAGDLLSECHPIKLREAAKAFECAGLASEAAQARVRLPEVASAWLAARMAEGDYTRLAEAVLAAEAEGISCADARAQLERLVIPFLDLAIFFKIANLTPSQL